jgi:hypothetical protein
MNVIRAKLSNPGRPDAAPVEIDFPVRDYEETYRRLAAAGMTSAIERESRVSSIESGFRALEGLWGREVNADELDYLAKRLDSFSDAEARQFEGVAAAKGYADIEDLINLTFCCQQATVISDFSNLRAIGKEHYLNTHGGSAPVSVIDSLDGAEEARELIME